MSYYYATTCADSGTSSTTGDVWYTWTSGTTSTSATTDATWREWTRACTAYETTSTTTTVGTAWVTWVGDAVYTQTQRKESYRQQKLRKRQEKIRAKEEAARQKELERLEAIRQAEEKERETKARQLLREVLTEEQDKQLDEKGYFELVAVGSGQRYRINRGRSRNINKIDKDGKVCGTVCFHPKEYVHNYDSMAIQKLMLENDEEEVRKVANFS